LVASSYFRFNAGLADLETAVPHLEETLRRELVGPDGKDLERIEITSEVIEW
jgi:hypothetical protein